jgi:hypothetical protein
MEAIDRFMRKVDKFSDCWIWRGHVATNGYGRFWNGKRTIQAHWFLLERQPKKGEEACHKCDNKLCVRPSHIFIGTRSDNMRDMVQKGRHNPEAKARACRNMLKSRVVHVGSENPQSKLTEDDVAMIKSIHKQRGLGCVLAKRFGVSEQVISGIWNGRRWQQVNPSATAAKRAEAFLRTVGKWETTP